MIHHWWVANHDQLINHYDQPLLISLVKLIMVQTNGSLLIILTTINHFIDQPLLSTIMINQFYQPPFHPLFAAVNDHFAAGPRPPGPPGRGLRCCAAAHPRQLADGHASGARGGGRGNRGGAMAPWVSAGG